MLMLAPLAVHAAPITFSTTGVFVAGAGDSITGGGALQTSSGATLSYANVTNTFVDANLLPVSSVSLGKFTLTPTSASGAFALGDKFTLSITQSDPVGGPGSSTANVIGTITYVPGAAPDSGNVQLTFGTNPVIIGQVGYFIDPYVLSWSGNVPGDAAATLTATVAAVPLPATANMGFGLIACVAGAGIWRKLKSSQAALS